MGNYNSERHEAKIRELEDEMMLWVKGEKSHWNYYSSLYTDPGQASVLCSIADAAEVQKFSAAIVALRAGGPRY